MIDTKIIKKIAAIARLDLDEKEIEKFRKDINSILSAFELINEVKTEDIEPSFQPIEIKNVTRKDEVEISLSQKEALKNAEQTQDKFFKGPRAV